MGPETILAFVALLVSALFGAGGWVGYRRLKAEAPKINAEADLSTASAQAVIISNLEAENERLRNNFEDYRKESRSEIGALRREVAELRGHLEALERLKVDQIAEAVVNRLVGDDPSLLS